MTDFGKNVEFVLVLGLGESISCPAGQPSLLHNWPIGKVKAAIIDAHKDELEDLLAEVRLHFPQNDFKKTQYNAGAMDVAKSIEDRIQALTRIKEEEK